MIRLASELGDQLVLEGRNDPVVGGVMIRVEQRVRSVHSGNLPPQRGGALAASVADRDYDDLASRGVHGNLDPVPVRLRTDKAPELIPFSLQPLQDHRGDIAWWLDVGMPGGSLESLDHKL